MIHGSHEKAKALYVYVCLKYKSFLQQNNWKAQKNRGREDRTLKRKRNRETVEEGSKIERKQWK